MLPLKATSTKETVNMKTAKTPYRHVVLFQFRPTASDPAIRMVETEFASLAAKLPFVVGFEGGRNSSPENLNLGFTHCFIVSFASPEDRDTYLPHPDHQAFCRKYLDPNIEKVCVVDFTPQ